MPSTTSVVSDFTHQLRLNYYQTPDSWGPLGTCLPLKGGLVVIYNSALLLPNSVGFTFLQLEFTGNVT